MITE